MPSGRTHDKITIVTALLSAPVWYYADASARDVVAYGAGLAAYLFSGFYLSDDLDTRCVALRRWGPLQWIWWPYQRLVPHRSWISHGIGVGPIIRVVYFLAVAWLVARGLLWMVNQWIAPVDRDAALRSAGAWLAGIVWHHPVWAEWALAGLVLGGVAHSVADALVSAVKRVW